MASGANLGGGMIVVVPGVKSVTQLPLRYEIVLVRSSDGGARVRRWRRAEKGLKVRRPPRKRAHRSYRGQSVPDEAVAIDQTLVLGPRLIKATTPAHRQCRQTRSNFARVCR